MMNTTEITEHEQKLLEKVSQLYEIGINELAMMTPRAYDISAKAVTLPKLVTMPEKTKVMCIGTLERFRVKESGRLAFVDCYLVDGQGNRQLCRWISSKSQAHAKCTALSSEGEGRVVQLRATVGAFEGDHGRVVILTNPRYEVKSDEAQTDSLMPAPVYTLKGSIRPWDIRTAIKVAIDHHLKTSQAMPEDIERSLGLMPLMEALKAVHGYRAITSSHLETFTAQQSPCHQRVRMEKIYRTLKQLQHDRFRGHSPVVHYSPEEMRKFEASLSFDFTLDQKKALKNIFDVLCGGNFQTMLLQGDVGSGKTVVAAATILCVSSAGHQSVMMAPSTVLAEQLYSEIVSMLGPMGVEVLFLSGKLTKKRRSELQKRIDKNPALVVVGTSAAANLEYKSLGIVVFDEEQKWGMKAKRGHLAGKKIYPHTLYMSATPLPRSISSSLYGNYKIIRIKAKPSGRVPVQSKIVRDEAGQKRLLDFIEAEANAGRVSLIVTPSISSGEIESVQKYVEICEQRFGRNFFGVIHGQMKEKEIQSEVARFRARETKLMIATSLVEAGFSDPQLSLVAIANADRWGLSSLHQIRGRVGRSAGIKGYCALLLGKDVKEKAMNRLHYFSQERDGFELSHFDMVNRGSGNLVGVEQSGGGDFVDFVQYSEEVETLQKLIDDAEASQGIMPPTRRVQLT